MAFGLGKALGWLGRRGKTWGKDIAKAQPKDIGRLAQKVSPLVTLIPGAGPLAAAGIGALGAAMNKGDIKDVVGGGLRGYTGAKGIEGLKSGIGSLANRGAAASVPSTSGAASGVEGLYPTPGPVSPVASVVPPPVTSAVAAPAGGGFARSIGRGIRGVGKWAGKNPELASQALGTAAQVYGAHQLGAQEDREYRDYRSDVEFGREREEERRQRMGTAMTHMQQQWEDWGWV